MKQGADLPLTQVQTSTKRLLGRPSYAALSIQESEGDDVGEHESRAGELAGSHSVLNGIKPFAPVLWGDRPGDLLLMSHPFTPAVLSGSGHSGGRFQGHGLLTYRLGDGRLARAS